MRILVVAAHPDDEVLGCGGTIARLAADPANEAFTLIVSEGCSAQYSAAEAARAWTDKKEAALQAGNILGTKEIRFGNFPDMKLDTVAHLDLNRFLEHTIREIKPDVLFTHHPGDINLDHQLVCKSVVTASRPVGVFPAAVFFFEIPSSTEWQGYDSANAFAPDVFIDISSTMDKKAAAMQCYALELREPPHPRSVYGIKACAKFRGLACGLKEAEGFRLFRSIDFGMRSGR